MGLSLNTLIYKLMIARTCFIVTRNFKHRNLLIGVYITLIDLDLHSTVLHNYTV